MSRHRRVPTRSVALLLATAFTGVWSGCSTLPEPTASYGPAEELGHITDTELTELSGIAASHGAPGLFWAHNDSGDAPRLFALNAQGERVGTLNFDSIEARDWEDMASFELDGMAWLLIADVGDNLAERNDLRLHLLPEPDPSVFSQHHEWDIAPAVTLEVSFEDGARDCEGVTVSPTTGEILLISKRTEPPVLYTVPLELEPPGKRVVARRVSPLPGIIPPTAAERAIPGRLGQYRSQVTAFDLSTDGRRAAALTYGNIWVYTREPGESWETTFTRPPQRIPVEGLPQAEALCFDGDSYDLIVTTERQNAPVQRYRAR